MPCRSTLLHSLRQLIVVILLACTRGVLAQAGNAPPTAEPWNPTWIAAPGMTSETARMPLFRKVFTLRQKPVRATLRFSTLGQGEVHLNGVKVGDAELTPGWTDYRKTVRYDTFDVTKLLHSGTNVIAVMVGNGMFNVVRTAHRYTKFEGSFGVPKLAISLSLKMPHDTQTISSDSTWQTLPGPITFSSTYGGEDYDATLEPEHWDEPSAAGTWQPAITVPGPGGKMEPDVAQVRAQEIYQPVHVTAPQAGVVVYDLGQNFAGWPVLTVSGSPGATVELIPGELLNPDGTVSQRSSGGPMWFTYTLRGGAKEVWHPRFTYYGFRYVQVRWTSGSGHIDSLAGQAISSDAPQAGTFTSSNETLNAIHSLILHAMHNNEVSIFTDCPHREKLGWLEETHLVASGLLFNSDLHGLFAATSANIADAQLPDGDVPTIAPQYTKFGPKYAIYDDSPEWGSASILAPWAEYRFYGDQASLATAYPVMQRYLTFLDSRADKDGIVAYGLGDWYDIGPKPPAFGQLTTLGVTATIMLYEDAAAMQQIATLLHHQEDAARYAALAAKTRDAFNARFFHADLGYYDTGSQTAQAMPLSLGIVPEAYNGKVLQHLIDDIRAHNDHVTSGEVGYPYLLRALMQAHRSDVIFAMLLRKDPPSYGSQLAAGATSLTEAWDANPHSSQDHLMLGAAEEFFYRGLAGFDIDRSRANSDEWITLRPETPAGLNEVKATYEGIGSEWHRSGNTITYSVTVPQGRQVTVVLPNERKVVRGGIYTYHWDVSAS